MNSEPKPVTALVTGCGDLPHSWDAPYVGHIGEIVGLKSSCGYLTITLQFPTEAYLPWNIWFTQESRIQILGPNGENFPTSGVLSNLITEIKEYEQLVTICKQINEAQNELKEILSKKGCSQEHLEENTRVEDGKTIPIPAPFTARMLEIRNLTPGQSLKSWGNDTILPEPEGRIENPKYSHSHWIKTNCPQPSEPVPV